MRRAHLAVVEHVDEEEVLFVQVFVALESVEAAAVLAQSARWFGRQLLELSWSSVLCELQVDHDVRLADVLPPRPRLEHSRDQLEVVAVTEKKLKS